MAKHLIQEPLVNIRQLSELEGIPVPTLRGLMYQGKIPFFDLGHRTKLFSPPRVRAALERFEVKEVGR